MRTTFAVLISLTVVSIGGTPAALAQGAMEDLHRALCAAGGGPETFSIGSRVAPPDQEILDMFSRSGASDNANAYANGSRAYLVGARVSEPPPVANGRPSVTSSSPEFP